MIVLEINNMTHGFGERVLYRQVQLQVNEGEHLGITGENGTGKSTLMNILSGKVLMDEGQLKWGKGVKVGYLDQHAVLPDDITIRAYLQQSFSRLFDAEQRMQAYYLEYAETLDEEMLRKAGNLQSELDAHNFYDIDTKIANIANGLGIASFGLDKNLSALSGGQKAKVILAKLFLEENTVYILDEPTNFLDVAQIEWLVDYLNNFEGTFLVVSHDFDFLEQVTTNICDIDNEKITKYRGTFQQAMRQKREDRVLYEKMYTAQQEKIKKEEAFIRKYKAGSRSTMARSRQKQLDHMEVLAKPTAQHAVTFQFPFSAYAGARVLKVDDLSVGYDKPLLEHISLSLLMGEKMVIAGKNGVGKSTLLKTILGEVEAISGASLFADRIQVSYFEQLLHWDDSGMTAISYLRMMFDDKSEKDIRRYLATLGISSEKAMQPIEKLSGGEQCKVKLCELTMKESTLLILDEPTNHLDDRSKNSLQEALVAFPGSILLVSHEPTFYERWVDKIVDVEAMSFQSM